MNSPADRKHQMFPTLSPAQIGLIRRFASGPDRRFAPGEAVYRIGDRDVPCWIVVDGEMRVERRDGLDRSAVVTVHVTGGFTGEVNQLSGRGSIAGASAGERGCTAFPLDAAHLRGLMIGSADIGELMMRALILRRVGLIGEGAAGTILIGNPHEADIVRLQDFLTRSGYPNVVFDPAREDEGRSLLERLGVAPEEIPLVVCPDGSVLRRPSNAQVAGCLGLARPLDPQRVFDVAIIGAGPAGLAAAVYGASEGLSVLVLDGRVMGGQAGASARIENYLGFPTGISGQALAGRAFNQAIKFGAEIAIPAEVQRLVCNGGDTLLLEMADDSRIRARTVVIAAGARYRRPGVSALADYEGRGVYYWASPVEARLCAGEEIALIGGGNSAGQAIVYLAPQVRRLHLFVRHELAQTMSRYLIDRIAALDNVEIHVGAELEGLEGNREEGLTAATFRSPGGTTRLELHHLFLFIGADPNSDWASDCVETDGKGFVVTGRAGQPLETSAPGVFAIGDVRAGSTKRVAAAVGEGAAVIAQIHTALARLAEPAA
nr:FAD-dependent oxidoreductase [Novosphingobium panipatense]